MAYHIRGKRPPQYDITDADIIKLRLHHVKIIAMQAIML